MNLKVGDEVQVVKSSDFPDMVGNIYKVITVEPPNSTFVCRIIDAKKMDGWHPLMYRFEIEKVNTKNQQLLFSFMSEAT